MDVIRFGNFSPEESAWLLHSCAGSAQSLFARPAALGHELTLSSTATPIVFPDAKVAAGQATASSGGAQGDGALGTSGRAWGEAQAHKAKPSAWAWQGTAGRKEARKRAWDAKRCLAVLASDHAYLETLAPTDYAPHGLYNYGNTCFLNASLHALFACEDVRGTLRDLQDYELPESADAPVLAAFLAFAQSVVSDSPPAAGDGSGAGAGGGISLNRGANFYPSAFRAPTERFATMTSGPVAGGIGAMPQQDAQEFLLYILDQLHEEIIALRKASREQQQQEEEAAEEERQEAAAEEEEEEGGRAPSGSAGADVEWEEVGKNNKSTVTRRHTEVLNESRKSRVTSIFGGLLRSTVRVQGCKPSVCIEPFSVLQLDISDPGTSSVAEAMQRFSLPEYLDDYAANGVATKTVQIEDAPRVLVIQLMRFSYTATGHSIKLTKECTINDRLCISKDTLVPGHPAQPASASSGQSGGGGIEYDLLATISHHGHSLQSGHYTASVKDQQTGDWFHCDDEDIRVQTRSQAHLQGALRSSDVYLVIYRKRPSP